MSPGLCHRILDHLEELGLLQRGDVLLDFMAGIGTTGLVGATRGYASVMVELEEKFIALMEQNRARLAEKLPVDMQIIQGDARRLSELLVERGMVAVCSPPYGEAQQGSGLAIGMKHLDGHSLVGSGYFRGEHSDNPANIGNLPDRPFVSVVSPPYEDAINSATKGGIDWSKNIRKAWRPSKVAGGVNFNNPMGIRPLEYGKAEGQIGQERAETYLSAMRQVYAEGAKVCRVLVTVTKNPTRAGKLRRLDKDTARLLKETGWRIVDYHRAILFEEQEVGHLFEGAKRQVKGRMSFFKRLSWQKGSVIADHEDIIIAVTPNGQHGVCGITSPPSESDSSTVRIRGRDYAKQRYGDSPGQIGKLKG